MIRIGPEHERVLKNKLRNIRALLLGKAPVFHAPGATPASTMSGAAPESATSLQ
jgi:hypothetical protein